MMNNKNNPVLSIIIPLLNEEDNVGNMAQRLQSSLSKIGVTYEILFIDDGSKDETWKKINDIAKENRSVKGISLSRNFGHQHALFAGLTHSSGSAIICMDGDLQHPPELIPKMIEHWKNGSKIVYTTRINSRKTSLFKRISSKFFYKLFTLLSGVPIHEGASDFSLIDRQVLESVLKFQDVRLFLRGIVHWVGFPSTTLTFEEDRRISGATKYTIPKMLKFAVTGLVAFSTVPLKLGIWAGLLTSFFAFIELLYILVKYMQGVTVPGWASTIGIISFLFGILFMLLGCIGMYLANIHESINNRPRFIINEKVNC